MIPGAARAAALLLFAQPALALDLVVPGAGEPALREIAPADTHAIATGPWTPDSFPTRTLEGAVTRQAWSVEGPASTLQLLAPLRRQVEAAGLRVLFACDTERCGGFDFRRAVEVLPPPAMFVDLGDFRYLSAEGAGEGLSILVSRSGGRGFVQVVTVIETMGPPAPVGRLLGGQVQGPPLPPDAAALGERLETEGRVVLEGLAFGTGASELGPGASATLAPLAAYLNGDPLRRVAIVGHTDAQGTIEGNVALSRRRAQAVAARLSDEFGVDPSQIEAEGMGYLAPLATNLTPEGRERNRRVEAVILAAR